MTKKVSKIKTMEDLEHSDCRWPIGDPRHEGFHFCGAKQAVGRPYCQEHWNIAFVPSKARNTGGQHAQQIAQASFPLIRKAA